MEQNNLPVIAKRLWSIMRVVYFMVRKGLSKRKLMVDLNLMMKRGKIAGKAIGNLIMFHHLHHHHHHHHNSSTSNRRSHDRHLSFNAPHNYEFSCDNSPAFPFQLSKRRNNHSNHHSYSHFFACVHLPPTQDDDVLTVNAVKKVLEMLNANDQMMAVEASPALPGFGKSPAMVRQLRVTDSPFPLNNVDDDHHVDEAAEKFIAKFYNELKKQKIMGSPSPW